MQGLTMGRIASFYYMKHQTMATFAQQLRPGMDVRVSRPLGSAWCSASQTSQGQTRARCCQVASLEGSRSPPPAATTCLAFSPTRRPCTATSPAPAQSLLPVLCAAAEYDELPVRHNEDKLNVVLSQQVRWGVDTRTAGGLGALGAGAASCPTAALQRRLGSATSQAVGC